MSAIRRIFSGIQPSGVPHIGNYFGAIRQWVTLQNQADTSCMYSIVDLHALTLKQDPVQLRRDSRILAACLLACGIDPNRSTLFIQSQVPEHCSLAWLLTSLCTVNRLGYFEQYREKSASLKGVPVALYVYPVLQAADILLYKATHVPVGSDQKQHLEFAGNLVTAFNYRFPLQNGEGLFPKPQALMPEHGFAKVKSLRNPLKKMSKSEVSAKGRVELLDSADVVKDKIMKAVTDFTSEVYFDLKERPGVSNLMSIHSMISGKTLKEITDESRGMETAQYKKLVGEELDAHLRPIRDEALRLLEGSSNVLDDVLADGASRAKKVAQNTWSEVRELIGAIGCGSPSSVKKERSVA